MENKPTDPRLGGVAGVTIEARKRYNEYAISAQMNGEPVVPFSEWLAANNSMRQSQGMRSPY